MARVFVIVQHKLNYKKTNWLIFVDNNKGGHFCWAAFVLLSRTEPKISEFFYKYFLLRFSKNK
jgi:hypothetical protein